MVTKIDRQRFADWMAENISDSNTYNERGVNVIINIDLDKVMEWIEYNLEPGDVFKDDELIEWAEGQGYELET